MNKYKNNRNRIIEQLKSKNYVFEHLALELFRFQYEFNSTYHNFCKGINVGLNDVKLIENIPLLPISAFKYHEVKTGAFDSEMVFLSSGTTDQTQRSQHHFKQLDLYRLGSKALFEGFISELSPEAALFSLLPSYIENGDSSLVFMMNHLSSYAGVSGFYLSNFAQLHLELEKASRSGMKTILIGVSYALLDYGEKYGLQIPDLLLIETGGMKGRRAEMIKAELHANLKVLFGVEIMSEYGMTELTSQFYAFRNGHFKEHDYAQVLIKDIYDPLRQMKNGKSGQIGIIDLLNVDSCAFIQTQDIGVKQEAYFEIMGRLDYSDIRGCSLMYD